MLGLKEAGVLGASAALAGGVAYLLWNYSSFSSEHPREEEEKEEKHVGEEEEVKEERREEVREERREEVSEERREEVREERREEERKEEVKEERREEVREERKEEVKEERREEVREERKEEVKEERRKEVRKETTEESPDEQTVAPTEPQKTSSQSERTQVLVLGLDGAGKTSLLCCFSTGCPEDDVQPTQGFNAVSINRDDLHIEFLEIGGREDLRPYWQRYMSRALLLVFVVDASDPRLFHVAKKHLHEVLSSRPRLPLMVLANKQDLPGSCSITDLHDALSLSEVGERQLYLLGTHVKSGAAELSSGVQDAHDMIIQMVADAEETQRSQN